MQEYKSLIHKPRSRWDRVMLQYAVIAGLIQFANTRLCNNRISSILTVGVIRVGVGVGGLQLFHQFFAAYRPSYLSQSFRTLIRQSKGLYSTALLPSLCAHWPIVVFWHCFASSIVISWQHFYHIGQLLRVFSSVDVDTFFSVGQWCLELSAFCHESWITLVKLSSA